MSVCYTAVLLSFQFHGLPSAVDALTVSISGEFRARRSRQPLAAFFICLGKLFTHVCLYHQAVSFRTGQGAVMPCGWEGYWPCVTDFSGLSTYTGSRANSEMSTPPTLSCGVWPIYLTWITFEMIILSNAKMANGIAKLFGFRFWRPSVRPFVCLSR